MPLIVAPGGVQVRGGAEKLSRNLNFWIFPDAVSGKDSTKTQCSGVLYGASRSRQWARSSSGSERRRR